MDQNPEDGSDPPAHEVDGPESQEQDPLEPYIPPGYELLRPNLDLIVEISLEDLVGQTAGGRFGNHDPSEISKIVEKLQRQERGITAPHGSPGNIKIDYGLARQQACHQRIIPMVLGAASQPLDVGRAQRMFPAAIRRALHVRDRGCIVPGCPKPAAWCEPHHIKPWAAGGPTALDQAALLCRHHHGAAHNQLLFIHMEIDGLPSVRLPRAQDPTQTRYRNVFWQT